ncbi:MAG TPA: succinate dehydrogenase cytochrome b subunit [Chitinophagaceae bacterium]|nr:succinate dehydrogenase cytochrome b subunit [Chitinophagaceae bacterium]
MKWSEFFTSAVGKKLVMALTGLFLISFLVIHVGLNACVFNDLKIFDPTDNGRMFNKAAHFMGSAVVIRILEIGLFIFFFIHIIQGYVLEFGNRSKRKIGYEVKMGTKGSAWYRKSMGLLGTLLLLFLIMHISHFWIPSRVTNDLTPVTYGDMEAHDLFARMVDVFQNPWIVVLYVAGCISLGWHLLHGFQSAFRTIGVSNTKYIKIAQLAGAIFSVVVPLLFALMPISMYFGWVGLDN